ncbi:MAG: hypothetical protein M9940_07975 [Bacteroidetes bacterium]|nr:hypothetical protein [Bacteroidota bacterium]MCB8931586.1 hypothetical protein [Bacteroidia bacterium]MCO5289344.1 hypothetical protein [Bacteroidota bacterium]MCW5932622.1 hypothetical protein [Bacteroidota bacterium]HRV53463.1 hypothetical protein [Bacteroidia bacterium]
MSKKKTINPFSKKDLMWLAKEWKLKVSEIKDLLGVTGSSQIEVLENHLRKTGLWNK